jgi:hypothetical protein
MAQAEQSRLKRRKLTDGRRMICPRCKRQHDILDYHPMMQIEEFVDETTPVYKCPRCRWVFAPADKIVIETAPTLEAVR